MRWGIWCQVSGGITGYRYGWLKSNGQRVEFTDKNEAQIQATKLSTDRNRHYPVRRALFAYNVMELDDGRN